MSEEELIKELNILFNKEISDSNMRYTDIIYESITNLQQRVEQLEQENKELKEILK